MNILITGSSGFIGSHLTELLLSENNNVVGLDNFDDFYPRSFKESNMKIALGNSNFKFYEGDIRNTDLIKEIILDNKIDYVVHLAAKAGVRPSILDPKEYYDVNVNGTLSIVEAMKQTSCVNLVVASSSSIYGDQVKVPFDEEDKVDHPISPYAASKKSTELLTHVYAHLYKMNITNLRFFTAYGPRQRPDLAIHKFTRLIDQGVKIPVFGDGNTARDYTYIDDIVDGIRKSMLNMSGYKIYNLGESKLIKLNELISTIEFHLGKKAIIERLPEQPGDVKQTFANIEKAKFELNYNPQFDFNKGIELFTNWYQTNKNNLYK
jgi:UDP-glucuronate 4-epimerase